MMTDLKVGTTVPVIPIDHLSATALAAQRECPMQFYGRYIKKWPVTYPPMMVQAGHFGRVVHGALEAHHVGQDAVMALCRLWGALYLPAIPDAFMKAMRLVRLYCAVTQPDRRDITERKFSITVPGVDLPVIGYIDVQRGLTVRELKTTGSSTWWTPERARQSLQTSLYSMAVSEQFRGAQATVEHHILNYSGGDYSHTVFTNSLNKVDIQERQEGIRETWNDIKKGDLNAICKTGKCRFPTYCKDYGYAGIDTCELVIGNDL